ncbi:MAG: hypothetical protein U0736_10195 [Gemmataceae bacterium]
MRPTLLCALVVALLPAAGWCQSRHVQLSRKFEAPADRVRVVAAGYLGGGGTEWLVGGGFQPDGTVVAVGVTLGPDLAVGGMRPVVLGRDAAAPKPPEPVPQRDKAGKVILDRSSGRPLTEPFAWTHENATAFVVRLSADLSAVKSVSRFPWRAGGATGAAVDAAGCIYLTGPAATASTRWPPRPRRAARHRIEGRRMRAGLRRQADAGGRPGAVAGHPAGAVRRSIGAADRRRQGAPQSADLRVLSADGKPEAVTVVPGGITTRQGEHRRPHHRRQPGRRHRRPRRRASLADRPRAVPRPGAEHPSARRHTALRAV